jgi:hypothetical protein
MFPVGLGLKVLFGSAILSFDFRLLLPVFWGFRQKGMWSVLFFVLAICFFAKHIQNPVMSMEKPNQQFIVSLQR